MAHFGHLATVRQQLVHRPVFDAALAYIEDALQPGTSAHARIFQIAVGESNRVELPHGAFALEQAYLTKPREKGKLESHVQYIDIQVLLAGEEIIEVAEIATLQLKENLTPAKDLIFYHDSRATSPLLLRGAGATVVFYPTDGHMGSLAVTAPVEVRKIVVKAPVKP